ncbi:unnamed protein product [Lathyrus oleraceus]
MNILSLNIRGGGSRTKRKRVSFLIQSSKFDICLLQETKTKQFDCSIACEFSGNNEVDLASCDSVGASGGMVILRKKIFSRLTIASGGKDLWESMWSGRVIITTLLMFMPPAMCCSGEQCG